MAFHAFFRRLPVFLLLPSFLAAGEGAGSAGRSEAGLVELASGRSFVRFAAIGGGADSGGRRRVSTRIKSWAPDFIISLGESRLPEGDAYDLDLSVGRYWSEYIKPYHGRYGKGGAENRFFPSLGSQDWRVPGAAPYLDYFSLPGNERYYEFTRGPVHLFALDSHPEEPDGKGRDGRQAQWLRKALAASSAPWKIVYFHHAPYSSGEQGSDRAMRWPFKEWGADAVMAGQLPHYERLQVDGLAFFVNSPGGEQAGPIGDPLPESRCIFNEDDGAMLIEAARDRIDFRFVTAEGVVVDTHTLRKSALAGSPAPPAARPDARQERKHLPVGSSAGFPGRFP